MTIKVDEMKNGEKKEIIQEENREEKEEGNKEKEETMELNIGEYKFHREKKNNNKCSEYCAFC